MDSRILSRVTREFSKYRAPRCKAKVLRSKSNTLIVEFSGTKAAFACCFDENFVDYKYYLKDVANRESKIIQVKRPHQNKFLVEYKLKNLTSKMGYK